MDDGSITIDGHYVNVLRWCRSQRRTLDDTERAARAEIEKALGDNETGIADGQPVVTWKRHTRTALDQRALRREHPDIHAHYCRTDEVRRFCLLEEGADGDDG